MLGIFLAGYTWIFPLLIINLINFVQLKNPVISKMFFRDWEDCGLFPYAGWLLLLKNPLMFRDRDDKSKMLYGETEEYKKFMRDI